ncbi:hypothetical protein LCE44_27340 [Vibrio harveyi]|uniref:hypothetical protein n=1 Tax=Vibrio harveyi TaxID=669 RepID=UPI000DF48864|nr:hypothetical protein [Vibrio harveyi]RCR59196.1 hypothetical protein DTW68_23310 [Vibrio harveyi]
MKTEYHLEIYEPDDSACVAASYQSDSPFMTPNVGDAIHGGSMNLSDTNKTVRVADIQHIFWEIENSHTAHKICVYTKPLNKDIE